MSVELIHTAIGLAYLALWLVIGHTAGPRRAPARPIEPMERLS